MNASMQLMPIAIMGFVIVLLLVSAYLVPRLTRPDLYFAVTVPSAFRDSTEGRAILGRYRIEVVLSSIIGLAIVLSAVWVTQRELEPFLGLAGLFLQGAGVFLAYFSARRSVLPHAVSPSTVREAGLAPRDVRLPGGWLAQLVPFALLAGTAIWLRLHWDQIPDRFPIHWGIDGQPNGWATRTLGGVFAPILIGAALSALMSFMAYAILRWSRPIRVGGPAGANERRFHHLVVSVLVATEYFLAIEFTWVGLLPLSHNVAGPPGLVPFLLFSLVFSVGILFLLIRFGQGGTRLSDSATLTGSAEAAPVGDRTEDRCWKLGLFYVNHDDPAVFVEKRFGIGYTLNFGHAGAWIVIGALVAVTVLIILLVPSQHH